MLIKRKRFKRIAYWVSHILRTHTSSSTQWDVWRTDCVWREQHETMMMRFDRIEKKKKVAFSVKWHEWDRDVSFSSVFHHLFFSFSSFSTAVTRENKLKKSNKKRSEEKARVSRSCLFFLFSLLYLFKIESTITLVMMSVGEGRTSSSCKSFQCRKARHLTKRKTFWISSRRKEKQEKKVSERRRVAGKSEMETAAK